MRTDNPKTIYLKDYQPPEYLVESIELAFDLHEEQTQVMSRLELIRNPQAKQTTGALILNGEQLELQSISIDGRELAKDEFRLDDECLTILQPPARFSLETRVSIRPQDNTALEGLYRSGRLYCTQCEAEGFRRITYFLDRPDVMTRFTTSITADKQQYPVLLSNGNLVQEEDLENGRHRVRWEDPFPKPCYLFALVAGDLRYQQDRHTTPSGREVDLRIYVEPENIDKCDHAMRSLKNAMTWDEQQYGREYDLDIYMIVAVNDFNMGAMENKGLNIFNAKFVLARPESATDWDFQGIEGVIAHEYFHNWTGNRITCRDWFQLSLKEGLTVFRDQEFSADMGSRGVKRIEDVRLLRAHQFAEDAGPMAHPVRPDAYMEINNFYTVTVYEKGAEVVRMQHNLLGPELYRQATDLYFERHDGQAVTTDDFVSCMEDAGGRDLQQFRLWYRLAGTPEVRVEERYEPDARRYHLSFSQTCPDTPGQTRKPPFHIPLTLGLLDRQGRELPLQLVGEDTPAGVERVLELTQRRDSFCFTGIAEKPVPSMLRGFSAPVKLRFDYRDEDLMFLMAHDRDPFNRWDAAQTLANRTLLAMIDARRAQSPPVLSRGFIEAFRLALRDEIADKALLTEVLSLPSESLVGDQMEQVDVEGIHSMREWLKQRLAEELQEDLLQVYRDNLTSGPYAIDPDSMARRSLKNRALHYLMLLDEPEIRRLCTEQFQSSDNMTDRMSALSALANCDCPERTQALSEFERQWRGDPLVMDKWFAVQANSKLPGTLQAVKKLMLHPAFSLRNPNKVRSLVGAFCSSNISGFHAADGSGYQFLADQVIALDKLNPQVAARLLRVMSRWRRYDPQRQTLMKAEFERVLAQSGLSRDVFEIASKCLEAS
ncbi:MAG: aminopeptidase N [Gammaproteobacteria bacterium]|nr:aminopeptidase N [Gammaproteobacteria bacterium]